MDTNNTMDTNNNLPSSRSDAPETQLSPWGAFLAEEGGAGSTTRFLKYVRGEWKSNDTVFNGCTLIANMGLIARGWELWQDGACIERVTAVLDQPLPDRDEMVWQKNYYLPLTDPKTLLTYLYSTRSKGGMGAVRGLVASFDHVRHLRIGQLPLVELGTDQYTNQYGPQDKPVLDIVGWHETPDGLQAPAMALPKPPAPKPLTRITSGGFDDLDGLLPPIAAYEHDGL
jgi:hypothetical protein